jgi:salicylate hydroxylase
VTLEDGTNHFADVVIGKHSILLSGARTTLIISLAADGIRSSMRPYILGSSSTPVQTGETAYRMLISALDLKAIGHPLVDENGLLPPDVTVVRGPARKVVAYPCRGGHYLNLVCFIRECA